MNIERQPTPGSVDVNNQDVDRQDGTDQQRRKAMVRMAAYTAPVMLAALVGEKAMAASASDPGGPWMPFPCDPPA